MKNDRLIRKEFLKTNHTNKKIERKIIDRERKKSEREGKRG
jgi:hypothetical protein